MRGLKRGLARAAAATVLAAASVGPAAAAALTVEYSILLAGLPIGTGQLSATFDADRYATQVTAKLSGLGAVVGGQGAANASGSVAGPKPLPAAFAVTSRSSSDERTVRMGLASGNVVAVEIVPPLEAREDRVPVKDAHKKGVVDPVSALLMPTLGKGSLTDAGNCNRTIPIFDGATRFNIVLSYGSTQEVQKPGYSGPVLVCNVRYVPIAGHRAGRRATQFMVENRDISVWLAPVEGTRVLVPLRISVRTMVGTSVIEASRFSLDGRRAEAPRPPGN